MLKPFSRRYSDQVDVLIVGAGPTGMTLALNLADYGLVCRIVESSLTRSQMSKAVGIHAVTMEAIERTDPSLAHALIQDALWVTRANMYDDGKQIASLSVSDMETPYNCIIDLPQPKLERHLEEALTRRGIAIERGVTLTGLSQSDESVTAIVQHENGCLERIRASYAVGCDGAHSTVRRLLRIPFIDAGTEQEWIVADVRVQWNLPNDETHLFFHPSGLLAAFPLPGERHRLVMDLSTRIGVNGSVRPSLDAFQTAARTRAGLTLSLSDAAWLTTFVSRQRYAKQFRVGRVFLAGDAAHIHSPAGGQGLNTGMQDASNLAWKLGSVLQGNAKGSLLSSYEAERLPVARHVLRMTGFATRLVRLRSSFAQAVRNWAVPLLLKQRIIRSRFLQHLAELAVNYRHSALVQTAHGPSLRQQISTLRPRIRAGDRAPDAQLLFLHGQVPVRLFHLFSHTQHTLLIVTSNIKRSTDLIHSITESIAPFRNLVRIYVIVGRESDTPGRASDSILIDPDKDMRRRYGVPTDVILIIRPDGYIGLRTELPNIRLVERYFSQF